MDLSSLLRDMVTQNQQHRARSVSLASRTVSAVVRDTPDEFDGIIRDATIPGDDTGDAEPDSQGGAGSVETGVTDGLAGNQSNDTPPAGI